MVYKESLSRKIFVVCNYIILTLIALLCIFPVLHILAVSLSSSSSVNAGLVNIWPKDFTLNTYRFVIGDAKFYTAFLISLERTVLGIVVDMLVTILAAYPLSKSGKVFKPRNFYIWFFVVTMLFSGGLIPSYLIVRYTGLMDTIWALIIPGAVPVFNVILLQNFLKELPGEIAESAFIDGAGHWTVLFKILMPLSKPVLATLILFVAVGHWNTWFDGMIYMNNPNNYPLQTYLQTLIVQSDIRIVNDIRQLQGVCQQNSKAAQIFVAMLPILCVYPFLQKYFTKGIVLGSVKE